MTKIIPHKSPQNIVWDNVYTFPKKESSLLEYESWTKSLSQDEQAALLKGQSVKVCPAPFPVVTFEVEQWGMVARFPWWQRDLG
jgi:hypothetical protein